MVFIIWLCFGSFGIMDFAHEILQGSYWEHFKKAKDLALIYPPEHKKRKELELALNEISAKIKKATPEEAAP